LLSGKDRCVPEALRPVVPALEALHAAAMPAELRGEAAARAYFRKVMAGESNPARPSAGAGEARTLILPAGPPGSRPPVARHRHRRRRPSQRGRWQAKALAAGAAAAVAIIGGAALVGAFPGSGGHPAAVGRGLGETSAATLANGPGSHGVDGRGTPEPSAKPTPTAKTSGQPASGPSPSELCSEYFDFFAHPGKHAGQAAEREVFRQLSSLAGGPGSIGAYCMHLFQPWSAPQGAGKLPGMPGSSDPGSSQRFQWPQGSQDGGGSSQHGGSAPGRGVSGNSGGGNSGGGDNGGGNGKGQGGIGPGARASRQR
jgi:hypothetical protein